MYFKDFSSGAMIENIVRRAKKLAIKRHDRRRGPRHPHRRPHRLDPPGVQGARGPAQHDQPRRLGEDLGQEGRAHRLHPHAARPTRATPVPPAAGPSSGWPPASTSDGGTVSRLDRAPPSGGSVAPMAIQQGLRDRDRVRHRAPRRRRVEPHRGVVGADQRLRRPRPLQPARSGWDFEDESPGNDARGFAPRGLDAARGRDPPGQRRAHQRRALLRRPRPPRVLDARVRRRPASRACTTGPPSASSPGRWRRPAAILPAGQEIVVYKNNSDRKGNSYGCHENYLMDRAVPFGRIVTHVMPHFVTRQIFTGAGKVGSRGPSACGADVPFQLTPAGRLLRGGGRARDHAQAPDRQHPRRAARRRAEVPPAPRDRRRRQPVPRSRPSSRSARPRSCWR